MDIFLLKYNYIIYFYISIKFSVNNWSRAKNKKLPGPKPKILPELVQPWFNKKLLALN